MELHASVNYCCSENFLWQSFQLKKSPNNRCLDKSFYHVELMQNSTCNKYIQVSKPNCHEVIFTDFLTGI